MKPAAIRWFEILLVAALAIDIGNNLLSASQMAQGLAERGVAVSTVSLMLLSLLPAVVGFGFWYFIVRRRNPVVRWILLLLISGSLALFLSQAARHGMAALSPTLMVAGLAELLKLLAALCLFLPGTGRWFEPRRNEAQG